MPNLFIDAVQQTKRNVVGLLVQDEAVKSQMYRLIDAQTQFYHSVFESSLAIMTAVVKNFELKQ